METEKAAAFAPGPPPEDADWLARFPVPGHDAHKHERGHAVVLAGRRHATGAARLTAGAALRVGAGLVTIAARRAAADIVAAHVTAVMLRVVDGAQEWRAALEALGPAAIALGPGLDPDAETREAVGIALDREAPVVLDAGALTAHAEAADGLFDAIGRRDAATVLTPHAGEFARLFGDVPVAEAAARSGALVVLKGPTTRFATPDGWEATSDHGPPWLATAGTGDVLAGLVTGLLAQGMAPRDAGRAAAWLHGEAARRLGPGMVADDMDRALGAVVGECVVRSA